MLLLFALYWGASYLMPTKYKVAMQKFVHLTQVSVADKPHDCNWDAAPIGNKYCHYDETLFAFTDKNRRVEMIYVNWIKVKE